MPYYAIEKHNCIYACIHKVASTSIAAVIGNSIGIGNPEYHDVHTWAWDKLTKSQVIVSSNKYRFAFVRNPFDRLVSAWADKVLSPPKGEARVFAELKAGTSFAEFVDWIVDRYPDPRKLDYHVQPQSVTLLQNGRLIVDEVFRFEQLRSDYARLQKRFGWSDLPHLATSKHNSYHHYYNDNILRKVEKYYHDDINYFGYEF